MNIVGITCSVNFGDYLKTTAPINRGFFDDWIIVTDPNDEETIQVAKDNNCRIVLSTRYKESPKDIFNKGKLINDAIRSIGTLGLRTWLCHIDADIVLPDNLRKKIEQRLEAIPESRRKSTIIGIHRLMCNSKEDWLNYLETGSTEAFTLECKRRSFRNVPVGFFQLWHGSTGKLYPENRIMATTSDVDFGKKFRPRCRVFLNETCIHLSQPGWSRGRDWKGRVSERWA